MTRPRNRFQRGSGCFACTSCKRQTRSTGGDNDALRLCQECYDMAGLENQMNDEGETPERLAEMARLKAACIAKGGKL